MSNYEALREVLEIDAREGFPIVQSEPVCILCESGYHDPAWEVKHVMQCGCPCHDRVDIAVAPGK